MMPQLPLPDEEMEAKGEYLPEPEEVQEDLVELPDGGALVMPTEGEETSAETEFDANLAETLEPNILQACAEELLELIDLDKVAREKRDKLYRQGLVLTGLDPDAKVGADFDGASQVVHPVLAEAAVDFAARAIKELFPANGPVRARVIGKQSDEKLAKAERKRDYLNWQLTSQVKEYRTELEQLLAQEALAGSQYLKVYWSRNKRRICTEWVRSDRVLYPFAYATIATSPRFSIIMDLTEHEVSRRVKSGLYRDVTLGDAGLGPTPTETEEESRRIQGKEEPFQNRDGLRRLYEVYAEWDFDGETRPYLITVDELTRQVISVYRNWEEEDENAEALCWLVEFPFVPWDGPSVGLVHLAGGLATAATGALNALLDSAHVNNMPTALGLKGSKSGGQTIQLEPNSITMIEGAGLVDDIRKIAMPIPFNPPSPVLFQLLGVLVEAARGVVTTASEKLADASNTGPVGTTFALIEQGAMVFSSIHGRLHKAQAEVFKICCRLNAKYLSDHEVVEELGELVVSREDFLGPMDVEPVSDPNIFSDAQRWAQIQTAIQLSQDPRVPYDVRKLHKRALELLKFAEVDEILPDPPEPQPTNPVAENVNATRGAPLMVFPHEDHISHLKVHLAFVLDPALGQMVSGAVIPLFSHVQQHVVLLYAALSQVIASQALGAPVTTYMADPRMAQEIDGLLADASGPAHEALQSHLSPLMPAIGQLAQLAQQQMAQQAQQVQDPRAQVALQVGMAEIQRKAQADQANQQVKGQELQMKGQTAQAELQLKAAEQQAEAQQKQMELQLVAQEQSTSEQQAAQEFQLKAAMDIAELKRRRQADIESVKQEILKNRDDNITEERIAAMQAAIKAQLEEGMNAMRMMLENERESHRQAMDELKFSAATESESESVKE